ncbi:hypothetical protein HYDPIDRAFT_29676 [Hydnomerulius pinastri MD-312]|uniref:Uncharacterized protein n=1 Tax=Hydnomerulius pinastri MD-312 TaxID=994086 RepID=A0A0C9VCW5_9AGAM|nr:hypothetical protein HYDPIDRAFT_29676 [Hydnomerulius pinastri MD-312]
MLPKNLLALLNFVLKRIISRTSQYLHLLLSYIRRLFRLYTQSRSSPRNSARHARLYTNPNTNPNACPTLSCSLLPPTPPFPIPQLAGSTNQDLDVPSPGSPHLGPVSTPHQYPPSTTRPTFPDMLGSQLAFPEPSTTSIRTQTPSRLSAGPQQTRNRAAECAAFAPEILSTQRYKRQHRVKKHKVPNIEAYQLDYSRSEPPEWKRCIHPEGAVYFCQERGGKRTVTDCNLEDECMLRAANRFTAYLWSTASKNNNITSRINRGPGHVELVIDVSYDATTDRCHYYFVAHDELLVFWTDVFKPDGIFYGVKGVVAIDHIRYAIETQYWTHCELYPNHVTIKKTIVEDLQAMLLHAASEGILADDSLAPFSVSELQQLLDLVSKIGDSARVEGNDSYLMCIIARLMRLFTRLKFINFYGQSGARLNADQSLYNRFSDEATSPSAKPSTSTTPNRHHSSVPTPPTIPYSPLVTILDPVLFKAPSAHVKQLRRIWVDHTINILRWRSFIGTLGNEWNGFTIYVRIVHPPLARRLLLFPPLPPLISLLLAVDVSFLAIPEMSGSQTIQTTAQVAIYLSTLSAVGSLITSVLLTNQSRGMVLESADKAASYMLKMAQSSVGLDALGIMYSLPFGLIMWGMIFFVVALSLIVFGMGDPAPRVVVVPFWVSVAVLASWPAWYTGERLFVWTKKRGRKGKGKPGDKGSEESFSDSEA